MQRTRSQNMCTPVGSWLQRRTYVCIKRRVPKDNSRSFEMCWVIDAAE